MGFKFKLTCLLLIAMGLATTVLAIDCLRGITYWDVAEINGITIGEFHPIPWRFESDNANANSGTVKVEDNNGLIYWSGRWEEVGCNKVYCEIVREGLSESWSIKFINPQWFAAYRKVDDGALEHYPLFRLGKAKGVAYLG